MKKLFIILISVLLCGTLTSRASEQRECIEIYFAFDRYTLDPKVMENEQRLEDLSQLLDLLRRDDFATITRIEVDSYASPEGDAGYNERLTRRRSRAVYQYLTQQLSVADSLIESRHSGVDWLGLRAAVVASDMDYRTEVLDILDNTPEQTWARVDPSDQFPTLVDSRVKQLMDLREGVPYRFMAKSYFAQLRRGTVVSVYFRADVPHLLTTQISMPRGVSAVDVAPVGDRPMVAECDQVVRDVQFALKTNLLGGLVVVPNIELEVPLHDRWSVAGEWIFPWWITRNNANALQVLSGQVEGRYWFGDRALKPQLTGWFAGVYAGGGLYDLQYRGSGYQGEFFLAAGLSGGYSHTLNRKENLRMEYSLGLGYLKTNYRYYRAEDDNRFLVWQHDGAYSWLGPTKAEVSLVWLIDWKIGGCR